MAKRGRKPLSQKTVVIRPALFLRPGEDDDLIAFFNSVPRGLHALAVKQALRSGKLQVSLTELNVPTDEEVEAKLDALLL